MAISDAAFAAWLRRDAQRTILCELKFGYESGGAPAEGTVYLSNRPYVTKPTDSPPNQRYRDVIRGTPRVAQSINTETIGGITRVSVGVLQLDNADGSVDFLSDLIIDAREAKFLIGDVTWSRSDFRTGLVLLSEVVSGSGDNAIEVWLRDLRLLLDKSIAGDVVNDNRRKPIVIGTAFQVELVQANAGALEYYAIQNFGASSQLYFDTVADRFNVRDNGVRLDSGVIITANNAALTANAATDTLTYAAHGLSVDDVVKFTAGPPATLFAGLTVNLQYWVIAAGLTANDFRLSLTKGGAAVDITGTTFSNTQTLRRARFYESIATDGKIKLSSTPVGIVTADVIGHAPTWTGDGNTGEELRAVIEGYGGVPTASIDASSFLISAFTAPATDEIEVGRAVLDRENVLDVSDDIARVGQIFFGPDYLGVMRAGRLNLSGLAAASYTRTLTSDDLIAAPKISNARVITGTVGVLARKNNRPLTFGEIASSVTVDDRRLFSGAYRAAAENTAPSGTAYSTNWQSYHKTATRFEASGAFDCAIAAQTVADEILGDLKPHIQIIEVETDLRAYNWLLGDVVLLTYPRYGFDAGKNCKVVSISTDLGAERVALKLITQTTPDYQTASH